MVSTILEERISILAGELQGVAQDIHIYERIFENVDLDAVRNRIADRLFLRLALALSDSIYSAMARITDPAESSSQDTLRANISVSRIQADVKSEGYPTRKVNKSAASLCMTAKSIRQYRSRWVAHSDDETLRGEVCLAPEGGYPLEEFLSHSQTFLDAVQHAIGSTESYTVKHESYARHADAFIYCLRFLEKNWEDVEQGLRVSNLEHGFTEFFSQTKFQKRGGNA
ncbi:hypothetical protein [Alterinioella nitratireducens]|uniref:hypothetical protein n=1 Tax=Alterinioella nitratireducens TaxID=2735915 RepID=UPI00405895F4